MCWSKLPGINVRETFISITSTSLTFAPLVKVTYASRLLRDQQLNDLCEAIENAEYATNSIFPEPAGLLLSYVKVYKRLIIKVRDWAEQTPSAGEEAFWREKLVYFEQMLEAATERWEDFDTKQNWIHLAGNHWLAIAAEARRRLLEG